MTGTVSKVVAPVTSVVAGTVSKVVAPVTGAVTGTVSKVVVPVPRGDRHGLEGRCARDGRGDRHGLEGRCARDGRGDWHGLEGRRAGDERGGGDVGAGHPDRDRHAFAVRDAGGTGGFHHTVARHQRGRGRRQINVDGGIRQPGDRVSSECLTDE